MCLVSGGGIVCVFQAVYWLGSKSVVRNTVFW